MSYYIQDDDEGSLGQAPDQGPTPAQSERAPEQQNVPSGQPVSSEQDAVTPVEPAAQRSDAGVGGAVAQGSDADVAGGTSPAPGEQNEPAMDMHDTTDRAKIDGIVAQTRADFPEGSDPQKVEHALRQRFTDVGLDVDDEQVRSLAGY